ncbi:unnamed protein product [Hyaloperonospora brassicae]|uniref:RxLR effector candidate protein n=1 Tax=Hyaloperonospora brassicae TaxID=162125 RepID=A0AAV0USG4_HYABA|nr:unnamed protein product [Hyaloperonospora brassicae]
MRFTYLRAVLVSVLLLNHSCHAAGLEKSKADALEARGEHDKAKRLLRLRGVDDADQDERMARIYPGHPTPPKDFGIGPKFLKSLLISLKLWQSKVPRIGWDSIIRSSSDIERLQLSWKAFENHGTYQSVVDDVLRHVSSMSSMSPTSPTSSLLEKQLYDELIMVDSSKAMVTLELLQRFPETTVLAQNIEQRFFAEYGGYDSETLRQKLYLPLNDRMQDGLHVIEHYMQNFIAKFRIWQLKNQPPLHTST